MVKKVAEKNAEVRDDLVLVTLRRRIPGTTRRVDLDKIEVDADKSRINVSKTLFESAEYKAIRKFLSQVYLGVRNRTLPVVGMRDGSYMLKLDAVPELERYLSQARRQLAKHVELFLMSYPRIKEDAQRALRSLYVESEYPEADALRDMIGIDWRYEVPMVPEQLKAVDAALYRMQRQQMAEDWQRTLEEGVALLRQYTLDLVRHAAERLTPNEDGTPKTFRSTLVSNLMEFIQTFSQRDVGDDTELAAEIANLRKLMNGVTPEKLRDNTDYAAKIGKEFAKIESRLDSMLQKPGIRKIA